MLKAVLGRNLLRNFRCLLKIEPRSGVTAAFVLEEFRFFWGLGVVTSVCIQGCYGCPGVLASPGAVTLLAIFVCVYMRVVVASSTRFQPGNCRFSTCGCDRFTSVRH